MLVSTGLGKTVHKQSKHPKVIYLEWTLTMGNVLFGYWKDSPVVSFMHLHNVMKYDLSAV